MSLKTPAPASLLHYQFPSDPPISLCNSTAMSLPLAQIYCGLPPSITPYPAPPLRQPITDATFILPLSSQRTHLSRMQKLFNHLLDTSLLPSPLQHQAQCLQAIHKTIQQLHRQKKAEQLDRKTLRIIVLQFQNGFALLRYLLFFSVGSFPISDPSVKNSATSQSINPNPNPTSNALLLPCAAELQLVVLPRRALQHPPERNQTALQTSTFSLQPPHGMAP